MAVFGGIPQEIETKVAEDLVVPGEKGFAGIEAGNSAVGADESFLGEVECIGVVSEEPESGEVGLSHVLADDLAEGVEITSLAASEEELLGFHRRILRELVNELHRLVHANDTQTGEIYSEESEFCAAQKSRHLAME